MIYLDNSASTPIHPVVATAMTEACAHVGNPSSAHSAGAKVRRVLERAREQVCGLVGSLPEDLIFTSGGTEANNMVLESARGKTIVTTTVEHSSVLKKAAELEADGTGIIRVPVDHRGLVMEAELERALALRPNLVSVQWVNNETGVVQPVVEIGNRCRALGIPFHVDAAQALGKTRINIDDLPIDFLTFTAHKVHGPSGVGAVVSKLPIRSLTHGGEQEHGMRAGTENIIGIIGFGVACSIRSVETACSSLLALQRLCEESLADICHINGRGAPRAPGCTNLRFDGIDGQGLIGRLDGDGIMCSQSSACANHRPEPSYVLRAMGLSEAHAYGSIRLGFSVLNTADEVMTATQQIRTHVAQLRSFHSRVLSHSKALS